MRAQPSSVKLAIRRRLELLSPHRQCGCSPFAYEPLIGRSPEHRTRIALLKRQDSSRFELETDGGQRKRRPFGASPKFRAWLCCFSGSRFHQISLEREIGPSPVNRTPKSNVRSVARVIQHARDSARTSKDPITNGSG